jgi:hydrogenase/urease accessory protein HupE
MFGLPRYLFQLYFFVALLLLGATTASAHFKLNLNVRVLHVEHVSDGLNVYMRLPMPYLVADLVGETEGDALPEPAPYTSNALEQDLLVHYVDVGQLRPSANGLGLLAMQGLTLTVGDKVISGKVARTHIYKNGTQPGFATLDEARLAFQEKQLLTEFEQDVYVGDTTVDILLHYSSEDAIYEYTLSSNLDPGLPDQDETANLVLDYSPGSVQVFRARGLLHEPIVVSSSALDAVVTFTKEGVNHILEGLDHVLFVICLVLGAMHLRPLFWRVTGFTIGHSITLSLGFFGFVPTATWFVPAVETGIALSIIYVAIVAIVPALQQKKNEWTIVTVTGLIGLLHGLGFSFVLQHILQVTSPNIWQSLLAFNLGVEIGQIFIVIATWVVLYSIGLLGEKLTKVSRYSTATACALMALYWVIERGNNILENI